MLWFSIGLVLTAGALYIGYRFGVGLDAPCNGNGNGIANHNDVLFTKEPEPCPMENSRDTPARKSPLSLCPNYDRYGYLTLYKHVPTRASKVLGGTPTNGALQDVFFELHHPDSPAKAEFVVAAADTYDGLASGARATDNGVTGTDTDTATIFSGSVEGVVQAKQPYKACQQVYLTRSGSRESMPNKCVAVVMTRGATPAAALDSARGPGTQYSPWYHSHRYGIQAKMRDMYSNDWPTSKDRSAERPQLGPILSGLPRLIQQVRGALGDPLKADGSRRTAIVMVANEGVMDLLLNFICSARSAGVDLSSVLVFLGQKKYSALVESMGAQAIYHEFYGEMPNEAADYYGDSTFGKLMWLKTTSVYVTYSAGFDVIFQDADLVWLRDPVPVLHAAARDIAFMDDGARSTRFTPFFVNSGFYYLKRNARTQYFLEALLKSGPGEISVTHSHQAALTRHLTEAHHLAELSVDILDNLQFPSGAMYHNNKTFIKEITAHHRTPIVFHMCWTSSREDKVKYFKELGMWFLPGVDADNSKASAALQAECEVPASMLSWVNVGRKSDGNRNIREHCCQLGDYSSAVAGRVAP